MLTASGAADSSQQLVEAVSSPAVQRSEWVMLQQLGVSSLCLMASQS